MSFFFNFRNLLLCLFIGSFGCNLRKNDAPGERIEKQEVKSFDWKMNDLGIEATVLFDNDIKLDSLRIYYGIGLIDSSSGKRYGGSFCLDTLSLKGKKQLTLFFPNDYFFNYNYLSDDDFSHNKANLQFDIFEIRSFPLGGKLVPECHKMQKKGENYFDYRIFPVSESGDFHKNKKSNYAIKDKRELECRLIYFSKEILKQEN